MGTLSFWALCRFRHSVVFGHPVVLPVDIVSVLYYRERVCFVLQRGCIILYNSVVNKELITILQLNQSPFIFHLY